jgi:putative protease
MKKPELLAPGGSFAAAYQAFDAGADGVYLGLSEFSARKAAANFSLEQLRRILGLARQRGRRIYVALNTVIRQDEMPRVAALCAWLESLRVDGVIIQDVGVLSLVAHSFPQLPIHASTQMAIHNDSGLQFAGRTGIRRVILSRELSLERLRDLRALHPDIELEVFIHGALCYSFSGLCLASWALTRRSGNRGDCAQICRSVFCGEHAQRTSPFSCRDLALGLQFLKLAEIGIDALKIEGRMKSPEYVFHVTRLYREILDKGSALSQSELEELQERAETTFSREKTTAYFNYPRGENLIATGFPGHRGIPLGTVARVRGREIELCLGSRVSLHDGVGFWQPGASEPVVFPVYGLKRGVRSIRYADAGERIFLEVAGEAPLPKAGTGIQLFSSRFLDRPTPKEAGFLACKVLMSMKATLTMENPGAGVFSCVAGNDERVFRFSVPLKIEKSTGGRSFEEVLRRLFADSGNSSVAIGEFALTNETGLADDEVFVPPSELKKARNKILAALEQWFVSEIDHRAQSAILAVQPPAFDTAPWVCTAEMILDRNLLSPPAGKPVPFVSLEMVRLGPTALAEQAGVVFVPLPPVMLDDGEWIRALQDLCKANPQIRFALGLNNVGQLELANRLAEYENCSFFVDIFLYVANRSALFFLASRVKRLLFAFSWIEGGGIVHALLTSGASVRGEASMAQPVVRITEDYSPPLFYSLGCYERHARGGGRCRDDCSKDFAYQVRQGRNRFDVVVKDCITYLFQSVKEHQHDRAPR